MGVIFRRTAYVVLVLILASAAWVAYHLRDRHPGYAVDLCLHPTMPGAASPDAQVGATTRATPAPALRVGFGRETIIPDLSRTTWLAGFAAGRKATAVHDDLWAIAVVIDDGEHRIGLVALDSIGIFHDDVIEVREQVAAAGTALDYVVVAATHNHSTPDLMGLWGRRTGLRGVDDVYRKRVITAADADRLIAGSGIVDRMPAPACVGPIARLPGQMDGAAANLIDPALPSGVGLSGVFAFELTIHPIELVLNQGRCLGKVFGPSPDVLAVGIQSRLIMDAARMNPSGGVACGQCGVGRSGLPLVMGEIQRA